MTPCVRRRSAADMLDPAMTLGDVVTSHPALARELERRGLDYCCRGDRSLADACAERELDLATTIGELRAVAATTGGEAPVWASMDVGDLVDHLEATHHRYLWGELPRLSALADKVVAVHGDRHPELRDVRRRFEELRAELEPHLAKEERVLFPMIRQSVASRASATIQWLGPPISVMLAEHDRAGALLAELRRLTDGYRPPPDDCASYRACYAALADLEADTHLHVHKENNLLFPAVVRLREQVLGVLS